MNGTNGHHRAAMRGPIRIGGCSGAVTDRRLALAEMAASVAVDAIAGDWMSEVRTAAWMQESERTEPPRSTT